MTLRVEDLAVTVTTGRKRLVGPVTLEVAPGEPLTILGETGAGKSLIAQAIMGALPSGLASTGAVTLAGERIDGLPRRSRSALWGRRIALLPQEPWRALDPLMRSATQVAESHAEVAGEPWPTARSRARDDLTRLGLPSDSLMKHPGTLSGGMAQRVAFAAATAAGARTLLADEPTKGLDDARRADVVAVLKGFVAEGGVLLTITHDVAVARALGGRALILREGRILEDGPAEQVLSSPQSEYGRALVAADPGNWPVPGETTGAEAVIRAQGLAVARGGRTILEGLDFAIGRGGRLAIVGPSGLGKTSLLDTLAGLIPAAAGEVVRLGAALAPLSVQKLYQDPPAAFPARVPLLAVFRDLERRHGLSPERIPQLLERLALDGDLLARRPAAVSGGELQRLALARVLALRPAVILADEPTSRLDPVTQRQVMNVIGEVSEEFGAAVALVTHNGTMARRWAGNVLDLAQHAHIDAGAARQAA